MKYILSFWAFTLLLSCNSKKEEIDYYELLTNKVWITTNDSFRQIYFQSKDNIEYTWWKIDYKSKERFLYNSICKGTPATHPFNLEIYKGGEGWERGRFFNVKKNELTYQSEDDIHGNKNDIYILKALNDTVIGVFNYKKIKITNEYGDRTWLSKLK